MIKDRIIGIIAVIMLASSLSVVSILYNEPESVIAAENTMDLTLEEDDEISMCVQPPIDLENENEEYVTQENEELVVIEEDPIPLVEEQIVEEPPYAESVTYENRSGLNPVSGVNYYNGWRETYYSSKVLYHYRTGEWTVDENGVYRDAEGYVIVSSSSDPHGAVVDTSFGAGKIYDTGCAEGTHDIYTNW